MQFDNEMRRYTSAVIAIGHLERTLAAPLLLAAGMRRGGRDSLILDPHPTTGSISNTRPDPTIVVVIEYVM